MPYRHMNGCQWLHTHQFGARGGPKFSFSKEYQKVFDWSCMSPAPKPHVPDHWIISVWIQTIDLHALQTHEWLPMCPYTPIWCLRWAKNQLQHRKSKSYWLVLHEINTQATCARPLNHVCMDPNNRFACLTDTWMAANDSIHTNLWCQRWAKIQQ